MLALAVLVAVGAGCRDEELDRFEALRAEICRCKTPSCGEETMKKVEQLELEASPRSRRIAREMMDCLAELYAAPAETGPDVPTPEPLPGEPAAPTRPAPEAEPAP